MQTDNANKPNIPQTLYVYIIALSGTVVSSNNIILYRYVLLLSHNNANFHRVHSCSNKIIHNVIPSLQSLNWTLYYYS